MAVVKKIRREAKRRVLETLPSSVAAYLRQERLTWTKQARRNMRAATNAGLSATFERALRTPVRQNTVFWESFGGNGALCNPEALFRRMLDDPRFAAFTHTWALDDPHARLRAEFAKHPRVHFVEYRSKKYFRDLQTSQFLVNNATFPHEFIKRPEQTYLNTWHGTPLKHMGYDMPDGADGARNVLRNFMSADFLLSQNTFMTEQMYLDAYRLKGVYRGAIIEEGYPRTDHMFGEGDYARSLLRDQGIETRGRRVLVYAPTWRGESFHKPVADAERIGETLRRLEQMPELASWTILLKAHQAVVDQLANDPSVASRLIPNDVPANQALAIADVLVSDYSSIFVDYLATGRPLVFHIPDVDAYSRSRGLYMEVGELPGPVSDTLDGLEENLRAVLESSMAEAFPSEAHRVAALAQSYTAHDDGGVSDRILDIVFAGQEQGYRVRRGFDDGRKRIAIYLGGMITNGITSSALNLLRSLDPEIYDVTALFYRSGAKDRRANAALIPPHVRQIVRVPGLLQLSLAASTSDLIAATDHDRTPPAERDDLWAWEWRRLFGHAEFDAVVDFSGYSPYWARLMAEGTAPRRAIWLHNDLEADAVREVDGVRPHHANLTGVFSLYSRFDSLVSVSPDLELINAESLSGHAPRRIFTSARNAIDADRILEGAGRQIPEAVGEGEALPDDLPSAIAELARRYTFDALLSEVTRQESLGESLGHVTFVSVGRLSPEKNHARLLRAFAQVHAERPDTRLVLIGDGPLLDDLTTLADSLGVADAVTFTGRLRNPYAVMSSADCFVLSSDYEGQPIVILEARVLGLPIVTTAFGSASSAMEGSGGLIVERSTEALAEGMRAFLAGDVVAAPFNPYDYNADVVGEFHEAVFGVNPSSSDRLPDNQRIDQAAAR